MCVDKRHYVHDFAFTQELGDVHMGWGARDLTDPSYAVLKGLAST